jgi:hypothetical protein
LEKAPLEAIAEFSGPSRGSGQNDGKKWIALADLPPTAPRPRQTPGLEDKSKAMRMKTHRQRGEAMT